MEMLSLLNYMAITSFCELCRRLGLLKWSVSGIENLPARPQGMILVANHIHWHDIPFIGWGLPWSHRPWWLAKVEIVNSVFGAWFTMRQVIPVRRGQRDLQALDRSAEVARNGGIVVIFPEGTRSLDGKLLQGRGGTVRIALRAGVPIVPVAIEGTQRKFWFSKRHLTIGQPYYPEVTQGNVSSDGSVVRIPTPEMNRLSDEVMVRIARMLPAEYHGYYAEHVAAAESTKE
jgi:1-acyl-sn-glycerol-3-phosphate acyltransferase